MAACEEENSVEVVKVLGIELEFLFGERFRVGADGGIPESGLLAQALNRSHGMGNGVVAISLFLAEDQEVLLLRSRGCLGNAEAATRENEKETRPTSNLFA